LTEVVISTHKTEQSEEEERWAFGRIVETSVESYTHRVMLRVEYRCGGEVAQLRLNPEQHKVAPFPTRSFKFAEHYHMRCIQRVYNEVANEMELCSQPFVLVVASWMRLREIELLVYQQVRHQIAAEGRFRILETDSSAKMSKKDKARKFKDYLSRSKPYQLRFTDQEGRCALCCKLQKSYVLESEEDFVC
jgi:hypothetical protein